MPRESAWGRALWFPVNLVQGVYTALWTAGLVPVALGANLLARSNRPAVAMARRLWAPGLLTGAGARLSVCGLERLDLGRPYFFVANHSSWIDIPALFRALPVELRFLAKRELARVPLLGRYIRAMGMVFIDRDDSRRASRSVGAAADLLREGHCVLSFPEGTRSRDGRLGRFKTGGFGAPIETGVAVVPVAILGAGAVLPADGFRVRPGRIEVRFGDPIPPPPPGPHARAQLARCAEVAVAALLGAPGDAAVPSCEDRTDGESRRLPP
ncbi:MAG TPA: lysophospholipid acyltransferase family protein [Thermoanaerobaculia bacterium]|nr:lysophospholipid acyltransferase family protein [Thermoanaerobaculia bacterium]